MRKYGENANTLKDNAYFFPQNIGFSGSYSSPEEILNSNGLSSCPVISQPPVCSQEQLKTQLCLIPYKCPHTSAPCSASLAGN